MRDPIEKSRSSLRKILAFILAAFVLCGFQHLVGTRQAAAVVPTRTPPTRPKQPKSLERMRLDAKLIIDSGTHILIQDVPSSPWFDHQIVRKAAARKKQLFATFRDEHLQPIDLGDDRSSVYYNGTWHKIENSQLDPWVYLDLHLQD